MRKIFALANVVIKELYRRKDFYVLFVLTALLTLAAGSMNFFQDDKIIRYIKDLCMLMIWVSALVIAIVTTARQIPSEREARTIFPLLAKPVSRTQVVLGKFFGCWLAVGLAVAVFYIFFSVISGSRGNASSPVITLQAAWMQWQFLGIVIAMVMLGSIYFAAPSSTNTIAFIVVIGILLVGGHLKKIALGQPEPMQSILAFIYYVIPHLEWFYLSDFVVYDFGVVAWSKILLATLYAAAWMAFFLMLACAGFGRKNLTV